MALQLALYYNTTTSAREVFVLVDDWKTPLAHVVEGQDHPAPTSAQDSLDPLQLTLVVFFPVIN